MKVLQINTVFKTGGSTGRIVDDLKCVQNSEGIEGYVAFGYGYKPTINEADRVYKICSDFDILISKIYTKFIGHHGFNNVHETKRLLNWIELLAPDIIHLHNIHNYYVNIDILLKYISSRKIPCIMTLHDCWSFTGHCAYFDYNGCNKWKVGCHDCPNLHDYPRTFALQDPSSWNYNNKKSLFDPLDVTLVTPSRWLANLVSQSFLKNKHCLVINNGVDTDVFKPCGDKIKEYLGIRGCKMILAVASSFSKRKGIDYLLQLPSLLRDGEILVLVGVSSKQKHYITNDKCVLIERTNDIKELVEYYSAADVFINPTLEDNFPTTNIEALACGTPVITFDTGGSSECIIDGEAICVNGSMQKTSVGIVVPKKDIKSLLSAIREILFYGKNKYIDACRAKSLARYNKKTQYMKYITLYKKIVE